jgi:ParB/RepB/Spo0J family partition protein
MAFGNKGTIDTSKQAELREARKNAMFSSAVGGTQYPKNVLVNVPLDLIVMNPDNEKVFNMDAIDQLAARIKKVGYDNASPVSLFERPDGKYELSAGHRRYMACKQLGMSTIPAVIKADVSSAEKAEALLGSNMYNRVLKFYDYAKAIEYYRDNVLIASGFRGNVRKALCEYFGITDTTLQRYLSVLKLIPELTELTKDKEFPSSVLGKAVSLSEDLQHELHDEITKALADKKANDTKLTERELLAMIAMVKQRAEQKAKIEKNRAIFESNSVNRIDDGADGMKPQVSKKAEQIQTVADSNATSPEHVAGGYMALDGMEDQMPVMQVTETKSARESSVAQKPVTKKRKVKKPDISTAVSVLNNQIVAIDINDFDVSDKAGTEKMIATMIDNLSNLLTEVKNR